MAWTGFTAASTPGLPTTWTRPTTPSTLNHTIITGPNTRPTPPVPQRCTLAMAVAPVLVACRVARASCRWPAYTWLSLVTSGVFAAGMAVWAGVAGRPGDGVAERVPIAVSAVWVAATAWWLRRSGPRPR